MNTNYIKIKIGNKELTLVDTPEGISAKEYPNTSINDILFSIHYNLDGNRTHPGRIPVAIAPNEEVSAPGVSGVALISFLAALTDNNLTINDIVTEFNYGTKSIRQPITDHTSGYVTLVNFKDSSMNWVVLYDTCSNNIYHRVKENLGFTQVNSHRSLTDYLIALNSIPTHYQLIPSSSDNLSSLLRELDNIVDNCTDLTWSFLQQYDKETVEETDINYLIEDCRKKNAKALLVREAIKSLYLP